MLRRCKTGVKTPTVHVLQAVSLTRTCCYGLQLGWLSYPGGLPLLRTAARFVHCFTAFTGFTGLPERAAWRFAVQTGSLTRVALGNQGAVLQAVNDTAHLGF